MSGSADWRSSARRPGESTSKEWSNRLAAALQPDDVVLGGGNAKKLKEMPPLCRPGDNADAFKGGFRMWTSTLSANTPRARTGRGVSGQTLESVPTWLQPQTPLPQRPGWNALAAHYGEIKGLHMRELFANDPGRGERLAAEAAGIYLDYSKNRITDETLKLLLQLAEEAGLRARTDAMFSGEKINASEKRAVLHVALRTPKGQSISGRRRKRGAGCACRARAQKTTEKYLDIARASRPLSCTTLPAACAVGNAPRPADGRRRPCYSWHGSRGMLLGRFDPLARHTAAYPQPASAQTSAVTIEPELDGALP